VACMPGHCAGPPRGGAGRKITVRRAAAHGGKPVQFPGWGPIPGANKPLGAPKKKGAGRTRFPIRCSFKKHGLRILGAATWGENQNVPFHRAFGFLTPAMVGGGPQKAPPVEGAVVPQKKGSFKAPTLYNGLAAGLPGKLVLRGPLFQNGAKGSGSRRAGTLIFFPRRPCSAARGGGRVGRGRFFSRCSGSHFRRAPNFDSVRGGRTSFWGANPSGCPSSWRGRLGQLQQILRGLRSRRRRVAFSGVLPWAAIRDGRFFSARYSWRASVGKRNSGRFFSIFPVARPACRGAGGLEFFARGQLKGTGIQRGTLF